MLDLKKEKKMRKDLFSLMNRIVEENLENYRNDYLIDKKTIIRDENKEYIWIVRRCGTQLIPKEEIKYPSTTGYICAKFFENEKNIYEIKIRFIENDKAYGELVKIKTSEFQKMLQDTSIMSTKERLKYILKHVKNAQDIFKNNPFEEDKILNCFQYGINQYEMNEYPMIKKIMHTNKSKIIIEELEKEIKKLD